MAKKRFTFNDETTTNSYGFKIPNAGISLERFNANPVMLDGHWNDTSNVIGKWTEVRVEGSELSGEPDFVPDDTKASEIMKKVEGGYIRGCSMGVTFNRDDMKQQPDGSWVLTKCELYEVSIVAIPSNSRALRLYAANGVEMKEEEVKLAVGSLMSEANFNENKEQKMEKIILSATSLVALGLNQQPADMAELDKHISTLSGALRDEKAAHEETKNTVKAGAELRAKTLIEEAKLAGKITGAEVEEFTQNAVENYDLTAKMLSRIPTKTKLSAQNTGAEAGDEQPKNVDEFEKLSNEAKLAFKTENPDAYKALFK
jgi:HK97 family phage prohead protease